MTRKSDIATTPKARKPARNTDREARLKSALKANMAKRKAQARKRAITGDAEGDPGPGEGA